MLYFKFHQNHTINEEFDFWGVKGAGGLKGALNSKIERSLIQNGDPNPHRKFQHSSSIKKYVKIRGIESTFRGLKPPRGRET